MKILQPEEWKKPSGYSNGIQVKGEMIFVAGQVAWNKDSEIVNNSLIDQVRQCLQNVVSILAEAKAKPEHIVRMVWYLINLEDYRNSLQKIGRVYHEEIGRHYPAMSLFQVSALLETRAKVEIEATAVLPMDI